MTCENKRTPKAMIDVILDVLLISLFVIVSVSTLCLVMANCVHVHWPFR